MSGKKLRYLAVQGLGAQMPTERNSRSIGDSTNSRTDAKTFAGKSVKFCRLSGLLAY